MAASGFGERGFWEDELEELISDRVVGSVGGWIGENFFCLY